MQPPNNKSADYSFVRSTILLQSVDVTLLMYFADLQLQLGGFGGINYMLHTGNPATRPMELMITKAGLTLPKLL